MAVKKDALLIPFAKIYFMITGYVFQIVIARVLSKALIGIFGYVNSVISPVNMILIQGGVQTTSHFIAISDKKEHENIKNKSLRVFLSISFLIFIGLEFFADKISLFITHDIENAVYFRMAAVISVFYSVYAVLIGSFNGKKEFKKQALFDMFYSSLKVGFVALGLFLGFGLTGLFGGWVFSTVLITVLAFFLSYKKSKFKSNVDYKLLLNYSLPIIFYQLFFYVLLNIDTWMLGILSEKKTVLLNGGNYLTVTTISRIPYQLVISITFIIFPFISKLSLLNDKENIKNYIKTTLRYAVLIASPFVILISVYPEIFLKVIYGDRFLENSEYLSILVVGVLFLALFMINSTVITALGKPNVTFFITLTVIPFSVILNYFLIKNFSMKGAVYSASLSFFTAWIITCVYIARNYGNFLPLLTFLRFAFLLFLFHLTFYYFKTPSIIKSVLLLIVSGIFIYVLYALMYEFGKKDIEDLKSIFKKQI